MPTRPRAFPAPTTTTRIERRGPYLRGDASGANEETPRRHVRGRKASTVERGHCAKPRPVALHPVRIGPVCIGPVCIGPVRIGPVRIGPARIGPVRICPVRVHPTSAGAGPCRYRCPSPLMRRARSQPEKASIPITMITISTM